MSVGPTWTSHAIPWFFPCCNYQLFLCHIVSLQTVKLCHGCCIKTGSELWFFCTSLYQLDCMIEIPILRAGLHHGRDLHMGAKLHNWNSLVKLLHWLKVLQCGHPFGVYSSLSSPVTEWLSSELTCSFETMGFENMSMEVLFSYCSTNALTL